MLPFSERVKRLRQEHDWNQEELGKRLRLDRSTVSNWERGTREPPFETVSELAALFGVSVDYLLGRTDSRDAKTPPPNLSSRWPNLSPDRRQRAYHIERAYRDVSPRFSIPSDFTNDELDRLLRMSAAIAKAVEETKEPDHS